MVRDISPATLAATAIVSLAIGFGGAFLIPGRTIVVEPIVSTSAWQESASVPLVIEQTSFAKPAKCDPFEVSDVAMEEVLEQMLRRGWRPPNQGDAIALLDVAQTTNLSATDPTAPMPSRRSWISSDTQGDEAEVVDVAIPNQDVQPEPGPAPSPLEQREPPPA